MESKIAMPIMYELRKIQYGSSEYYKFLESLKPSLDFHYRYNRHHPEHYPNGYSDMTFIDRVEMMADWKAATKRSKNGNILESIEKNQGRHKYSDTDKEWFKKIVKDIG
jgi:hypothetical protein